MLLLLIAQRQSLQPVSDCSHHQDQANCDIFGRLLPSSVKGNQRHPHTGLVECLFMLHCRNVREGRRLRHSWRRLHELPWPVSAATTHAVTLCQAVEEPEEEAAVAESTDALSTSAGPMASTHSHFLCRISCQHWHQSLLESLRCVLVPARA